MSIESSDMVCNGSVAFESNRAVVHGSGIAGYNSSLVLHGDTF